jgi:hypothetical protein
MQFEDLEKLLSNTRLENYYLKFPNNKQKALEFYQLNTQIAESLYPLLSNFEVVLRNSINYSFIIHFKSTTWYENLNYPELTSQINEAKAKIHKKNNQITSDRIVSELTLGFWTSLFNKKYAKDLWKPLMYIFPYVDKQTNQRNIISNKLNNIRKFRNRIFHFEPICNDLQLLKKNHYQILELLDGINKDVLVWTKQIDRFDELFIKAKIFNP